MKEAKKNRLGEAQGRSDKPPCDAKALAESGRGKRQRGGAAMLQPAARHPSPVADLCAGLRLLFDGLFGDGAGARILPEDNLREASACYLDFLGFAERQVEEAAAIARSLAGAYGPERVGWRENG